MSAPVERFEVFVDPVDGARWSVDVGFLGSNWRCLWGAGCVGILDRPAAELGQGCCSVGAELLDDDEARTVEALGLTLDPEHFEYVEAALDGGVLSDPDGAGGPRSTRVVDGACIFLNRPGFPGGEGCALHLAATAEDDSPIDWKPSVCWQLPLRVEGPADASGADGGGGGAVEEAPVRVLRRWRRADWGSGGETMAWCCTEGDEAGSVSAYDGDRSVAHSMADELRAVVGPEVAVAIGRRLDELGSD